MNIYNEKLKNGLIIFGGLVGWLSALSYFFTRSDSYFGRNYHFLWPYTFILSLVFVLVIYLIFRKKTIEYKDISQFFIIFIFNFLSVYGVFLGILMGFSIANLPHIPKNYHFYGGHYFFSSIIFYLIFFRLNKEFMGMASNIIYWFFIILMALVLIVILFSF